jgi:hypothetical protein
MGFLKKNTDKAAPLGAFGPAPGKAPPKVPAPPTSKAPNAPTPKAPVAPVPPAKPPAAKGPVAPMPVAPKPAAPKSVAPVAPVAKTVPAPAVPKAPVAKPFAPAIPPKTAAVPKPVAPAISPAAKTPVTLARIPSTTLLPKPVALPTPIAPAAPSMPAAAPPVASPTVVPQSKQIPTERAAPPAFEPPVVEHSSPDVESLPPSVKPLAQDVEPLAPDMEALPPDEESLPVLELDLPEAREESTTWEDQIVADALKEDVSQEKEDIYQEEVASAPVEPQNWVVEAELLPAKAAARRTAKPNYAGFTADESLPKIEADMWNFGDWLRSRPKWFWAVLVVAWIVVAVGFAKFHPWALNPETQQYEQVRKLYLDAQAKKEAAANQGKQADQSGQKSDAAAKTPADSPAK